ncbi:hypothetical protein OS493_014558 [Desmophyllum pertusum]|uniref:Uncharacterized protein n=1 Tax=Desmophyllum pertusum TaxID=174260 RepID=A0A9X0CKL1_9CNID|nr:hypothetical protein OS493_014558 [Desmophyllum pertusum]
MRTTSFAFGTLIALISCLTGVSCQLRKCWGPQNYCYSWGGTKAVCVDGYCYCSGQDYDYNTCLPDAYGCKIVMNSDAALAKPQYNQQYRTNYSCTPVSSSTQYEVHVLGVYEAEVIHRRPPVASDATVNIVSQRKSNRPIILVLGNYEPVNWILNIPAGITITKVILVAYYIDKSSVSGDVNQVKAIERKSYPAQWPRGIGSDSGGGDTVGLLKKVYNRFGVVTSFTGTYKANKWSLDVLSSPRGPSTGASTGPSTGQITPFTPVWPQSTPLKPVWSSQNTPSPTPVGSEVGPVSALC